MASDPPCPDLSLLKKLLDGSVAEPEQDALHKHLETCAACQQRLEKLAAGVDSWAAVAGHLGGSEPGNNAALRQAMEQLQQAPAIPTQDEAEGCEEISLAFLDPPAKPRQLGKLDHYEIIEMVGRGGMGIVFKALDPSLHRIVAVKVMAPQFASIASARQRFLREARAAAAVCHEHVVTIHAVAEAKGVPYLVMQFVGGVSLQERLERRGPLNLDEILRIGMQTAQGLAAAHAQGLVHRDIKPANILLENGVERVKITDFGLARAANDVRVTQSGVIVGTPQYMAPEQARGEVVDPRADLFSLGSVLYFMCTGQPPFQGDSSLAVLRQVCDDTPPPVQEFNPSTPDWLVEIIARLQAKELADRFQSANEIAELLGEYYVRLQQGRSQPSILKAETICLAAPELLDPSKPARSSGPTESPTKSKRILVLGVAAIGAFLLCCGGVLFVFLWFLVPLPHGPHMIAERIDADTAKPTPSQKPAPPATELMEIPRRREADGGPAADAIPAIAAPHLTESKVEIRLSEPFAQVRTGGGGRYLVFHLKKAKKLAIFDVSQAKITREIDAPSDDVLFAAGRDKLMVVVPGQRLLQRWDLHTGKREKTVPISDERPIRMAVMGCNSDGPLMVWSGGKVQLWDVGHMQPYTVKGLTFEGDARWGFDLRVSADGQTFICWATAISDRHYAVMHLRNAEAINLVSPDGHTFNGHWAMPNADGSLVFRFGAGIYNGDMKIIAADSFKGAVLLPTEDPRFFLAVREESRNTNQVSICANADCRPVFTVRGVEKVTGSSLNSRWGQVNGEPRIHYLHSAHVLLTLPESNDRVVVRPLNLLASLDQDGKNYLFVLSAPRTRVRSGSAYDYSIDVRSKAGGIRCKLEAGPEGMTVSSGGRLRWQVPAGQAGKKARVIVNIRDASGKEIQHSFEIVVE
ncbi:MAG TPA: serine/threonine-protein kinase [Gemmataceae bacterium]|nr:serine/threonine-protein kinase [Gemmataceae bacterium]